MIDVDMIINDCEDCWSKFNQLQTNKEEEYFNYENNCMDNISSKEKMEDKLKWLFK